MHILLSFNAGLYFKLMQVCEKSMSNAQLYEIKLQVDVPFQQENVLFEQF